jgi:chromosome segregation ATPase
MADRISSLEAEKLALESQLAGLGTSRTRSPSLQPSQAAANDPGIAQLRLDLAEALRSKGVAEARLRAAEEELDKLRLKTKQDSRTIKDLTAERSLLATKVHDREYELKEKRKLVEVFGLIRSNEIPTLPFSAVSSSLTRTHSKSKMK